MSFQKQRGNGLFGPLQGLPALCTPPLPTQGQPRAVPDEPPQQMSRADPRSSGAGHCCPRGPEHAGQPRGSPGPPARPGLEDHRGEPGGQVRGRQPSLCAQSLGSGCSCAVCPGHLPCTTPAPACVSGCEGGSEWDESWPGVCGCCSVSTPLWGLWPERGGIFWSRRVSPSRWHAESRMEGWREPEGLAPACGVILAGCCPSLGSHLPVPLRAAGPGSPQPFGHKSW